MLKELKYELIYFKDIWLSQKEQYRWYQVDYQVGVLISRSTVNIIQFRKLWVLPILQVLTGLELGTSHQLIKPIH
ncbi:battenin-like [Limulus polyphemus]|uniref:Battenin-like n=1 Tax=Limulus polyphemus TaxID=6850 RepID=A0ABM1SDJ8_LIMPO|nr:battenin-like [Limulus polyphemus]